MHGQNHIKDVSRFMVYTGTKIEMTHSIRMNVVTRTEVELCQSNFEYPFPRQLEDK